MVRHTLLLVTILVSWSPAQPPASDSAQTTGKRPAAESKKPRTVEVGWDDIAIDPESGTDTVHVAAPPAGTSHDSTQTPPSGKVPSAPTSSEQKETGKARPRTETAPPAPAPAKEPPAQPANEPVRFAVEIPAGVLFGEFNEEDGPFLIKGSVIVPAGQTLKFGPGCKVYLGGQYPTITVFGEMLAQGTPDRPIFFRSANPDPNPWDWDRIYCRSRNRSVFEYCTISHSNYGITVENGAVTIKNCTFERNSLNGLVVKNSDAVLRNCTFSRGHVLALFCQAGANVQAESLFVKDNITGIACSDKAFCKLTGGVVSGNRTGIAVRTGASVPIVGTDVTRNKIGVVAEQEVPKRSLEMVYGNGVNLKMVTAKDMEEILKPPESVKSIVLPKAQTPIQTAGGFQPGFTALKAPREATASFIGNVTAGARYFRPESEGTVQQTVYIGEHTDKWYGGLQPEVAVFAQGKKGDVDANLNMSLRANNWLDTRTSMRTEAFTLSIDYRDQSLLLGDFYENTSELSISGRELTGFRYTGNLLEMGRGTKRIEFKLAGGESEVAKDSGFHEYDRVEDVDSGFSVRQQLSYVAGVSVKPTHFSTVSARAIISRDQTNEPLFREKIKDPGVSDPVAAQMGILDGSVVLLDGKLELSAEIAMGAHDTLYDEISVHDTATGQDSIVRERHEDYDKVAWYNPQVFTRAIPRVFGLFSPDSSSYAFALNAKGSLGGFDLGLCYTEIAERFYSAGNPYLEGDRRYIKLSGERMFSEKLSGDAEYMYERASVSLKNSTVSSPEDRNYLDVGVEYSFGEGLPTVGVDYGARIETSSDFYTDTTGGRGTRYEQGNLELKNYGSVEVKQRFVNGMDYSLKYRLVHDNDMTEYLDATKMDDGDGMVNEVSGRYTFRVKKFLRNKTSFKLKFNNEHRDEADEFSYKLSDDVRLDIIPRKLTLNLKGAYESRSEEKYEETVAARVTTDYSRTNVQGELKYSFTSRLSATGGVEWERVKDQTEDAEQYKVIIGGLFLTYLF